MAQEYPTPDYPAAPLSAAAGAMRFDPVRFRTGPRITGRMTGAGIALIGTGMLGFALGSQFLYGLSPCELCIYQRWPWLAAIVLGLAAAGAARHKTLQTVLLVLMSLSLLGNAGLASFHVGVEQHWWEGLASCMGNLPQTDSIEALRAKLLATPTASCSEVSWSLFGISMAGYNLLICLALGLFGLTKARHVRDEAIDAEV